MRNFIFPATIILLAFSLVACQSRSTILGPNEGLSAEFFKDVEGRWITVRHPEGWVAKLSGTDITPTITVADNWEKYENDKANAIGIIIVPLTDKGSAGEVLQIATERLKGNVTDRIGEVLTEKDGSQEYAWAEHKGISFQDGAPLYYFLTVITTNQRSALVFTSVIPGRQETVRPTYQSIVRAITLH